MTVQQNIENVNQLLDQVKNHPMCLRLRDECQKYIVEFPNNVDGLDGIRIDCTGPGGKSQALRTLLDKLEHFWQLDNPALFS